MVLLVAVVGTAAVSQTVVNYPGAGVFRAGKLWDSFLPQNVAPAYIEQNDVLRKTLIRIGNFDRQWSTPTHMWPGGWDNGQFWAKGIYMTEFNPDTSWNASMIAGKPNPSFFPVAGGSYAFASYRPSLLGADDPQRNYSSEAHWADSLTRREVVYEAGWPTTIGVDVRLKVRQFALNWNNFDDCIFVEMKLINTGVVDIDADGASDRTNNVIRALTLLSAGEFMCSYSIARTGYRLTNRFGAGRAIGYLGDTDPLGDPWDFTVAFPGESSSGVHDMGMNNFPLKYYTDVWSGWSWLAAKQGSSFDSLVSLPDKQTLYGTHPIGEGLERGWYASAGHGKGIGVASAFSPSNPKEMHTAAMGVWYLDGGKSRSSAAINRSPDPNFFASGTPGDPTTFVPLPGPSRPRGDRKLYSEEGSAFEVNPYEASWTRGFTGVDNFDGDLYSGIGPFTLAVGETVTVAWVEVAGFRLAGVSNAIAAARWAYENNFQLPEPPAVPDLLPVPVSSTTMKIFWNDAAESHPDFAGYKIYRAASSDTIDWLQGGMRGMERYWMNDVPGPAPDSLLAPVNPLFIGQTSKGIPNSWGPYTLLARMTKDSLNAFRDTSRTGYAYSYFDSTAQAGIDLWYYVAAYTDAPVDLGPTYSGYNSPAIDRIETSNLNRNGASGLWLWTYPFADQNTFFPTTSAERKQIGASTRLVANALPAAPEAPATFSLEQNWPNPFNPVTTIKYTVGGNGVWGMGDGEKAGAGGEGRGTRKTVLVIYDLLGRQVATLVDEAKAPGSYEVKFDASGLSSGIYFYRLTSGSYVQTRAMMLLK